MNNVNVFFHIARMGSFWREVVEYTCGALDGSGLHNAARSMNAVCVGDGDLNYLPIDSRKWSSHHGGSIFEYEYPTLQKLYDFCQSNQDSYVLYLHTKGVREEKGERWFRSQWRRYMIHHLVTRWRECVGLLNQGYDTVGCIWRKEPLPHYSGNFWWAKASYIATLPPPEPLTYDGMKRIWAEFWLGRNNPKYFDFGFPDPHLQAAYWKQIYRDPIKYPGETPCPTSLGP